MVASCAFQAHLAAPPLWNVGRSPTSVISVAITERTAPTKIIESEITFHAAPLWPTDSNGASGALPRAAFRTSPSQLKCMERMKHHAPHCDQLGPSFNRGQSHPTAIKPNPPMSPVR